MIGSYLMPVAKVMTILKSQSLIKIYIVVLFQVLKS